VRPLTIIDYEAGNVGSVANIVKKAGGQAVVSGDAGEIAKAARLVLPGVGHFGTAMERLRRSGIAAALEDAVRGRSVPLLGICLGMQLLARHSEEGDSEGLGWLDAEVVRFRLNADRSLKVPHMGWNEVTPTSDDWLLSGLPSKPRFYFVHSYHMVCNDPSDEIARASHGYEFTAAVGRGNIRATQFHPEKSHRYGLAVIRNFLRETDPWSGPG
jgi:glutamine amidotransferase